MDCSFDLTPLYFFHDFLLVVKLISLSLVSTLSRLDSLLVRTWLLIAFLIGFLIFDIFCTVLVELASSDLVEFILWYSAWFRSEVRQDEDSSVRTCWIFEIFSFATLFYFVLLLALTNRRICFWELLGLRVTFYIKLIH